jgi:DNA-binding transcriptional LysR family regulator
VPPEDSLDWDDLRYFLRAAQAKTLAGAARATGVEHTTIGRRLSSLERSVGAALVLRGPEGLKLTPLGEKLVPLVEEIERSVTRARELASSERGRVRLAVPSGFTRYLTPGLARLSQEHPGLTVELVSGARPVDLEKGEADLAVRSAPVTSKDLVVKKLCESGWSLYASKAYIARRSKPVDPDDLSGHDVIGYDPSLASVPASKWIEDPARRATIVLRSREMTDMIAAGANGLGIVVVPCAIADDDPALERLTPRVIASRTLSLVYRREARLSKEVRAVIAFVTAAVSENAARISGRSP